MRHRIFIAINLPEDVKKRLLDYQRKWLTLPVHWTKKDNLHITLIFLGYLNDEDLLETIKIVHNVVEEHQSFFINLNQILYGPPNKTPRMVWVEGEKSQELANLQRDLENALYTSPNKGISGGEIQSYSPHITLGRIKEREFKKIPLEEKEDINEEISINFSVESIEVMESDLKRGGPEYIVLESAQLADSKNF